MNDTNLYDQIAIYEKALLMKEGLPHLYCFPFYPWQREFWDCTNAFQFNFSANQVGKSSVMIRKLINYHTNPDLWKQFKGGKLRLSFYLYPDKHTIKREIETKWPEFLPCNGYEEHPQYGFKIKYEGPYPSQIEWKSGGITVLRSYGGGATKETAHRLQASSPQIVACDEELPFDLWPELQMRIQSPANAGAMFFLSCTPTRGQKYLADIQSGKRKIPNTWVKTTSMYDCLFYEDGSKGLWTKQKIKEIEQTLPTQREIDVRVNGLFKKVDGLALPAFDETKNVKPSHPIRNWQIQAGIDYGIGGAQGGHPSAIVFIAVKPDYTDAKIIHTWKAGTDKNYTVDEVINRYLEMCKELNINHEEITPYYDWACGEMGIIADRRGLGFLKAIKDRKQGFDTLNSLFKNQMLTIFQKGDWEALVEEIGSYAPDSKENDDLIDALRYAISLLIFNFENIKVAGDEVVPAKEPRLKARGEKLNDDIDDDWTTEEEIDNWNEEYEFEGYAEFD